MRLEYKVDSILNSIFVLWNISDSGYSEWASTDWQQCLRPDALPFIPADNDFQCEWRIVQGELQTCESCVEESFEMDILLHWRPSSAKHFAKEGSNDRNELK